MDALILNPMAFILLVFVICRGTKYMIAADPKPFTRLGEVPRHSVHFKDVADVPPGNIFITYIRTYMSRHIHTKIHRTYVNK